MSLNTCFFISQSSESSFHSYHGRKTIYASLQFQKIPTLWKTSCLVHVAKKKHPSGSEDNRLITFTSHIMKTFEKLVLFHMMAKVSTFADPLRFAYSPTLILMMLLSTCPRESRHFECSGKEYVYVFGVWSAFNRIQLELLGEKSRVMQVKSMLVFSVLDYPTTRPKYMWLQNCVSKTVQFAVQRTASPVSAWSHT